VESQEYENKEHLIFDAQSTDETLEILRKYSGSDYLHWVSEPDMGQADAIMKGFHSSSGSILCWLNSDDIYTSTKVIREVVEIFQAHPEIDVVTGGGIILSETGTRIRDSLVDPDRINFKSLRCRNAVLQPATFFRKTVLTNTRLDTTLHYTFDWDFWIRLARDHTILAVDKIWAGYRWWGENKTAAGHSSRTKEQAEVARRYLGKTSWQYWTLSWFYLLYRAAEQLPTGPQRSLKQVFKTMSQALSRLSGRRIAVI
jgi:glycosyltransferase involved in cell wall biosynthesis